MNAVEELFLANYQIEIFGDNSLFTRTVKFFSLVVSSEGDFLKIPVAKTVNSEDESTVVSLLEKVDGYFFANRHQRIALYKTDGKIFFHPLHGKRMQINEGCLIEVAGGFFKRSFKITKNNNTLFEINYIAPIIAEASADAYFKEYADFFRFTHNLWMNNFSNF